MGSAFEVTSFAKVAETLGQEVYGRLLAWQLMAGNLPFRASVGKTVLGPGGWGGLLDEMARALHEMRGGPINAPWRAQRSRAGFRRLES
jgi:hypothetical protein